jgi:hypothetical protein
LRVPEGDEAIYGISEGSEQWNFQLLMQFRRLPRCTSQRLITLGTVLMQYVAAQLVALKKEEPPPLNCTPKVGQNQQKGCGFMKKYCIGERLAAVKTVQTGESIA